MAALAVAVGLLLAPVAANAAEVGEQYVSANLTSATVEARINPQGTSTTCQAQYVSETGYEARGWAAAKTASCSPESLGSGSSALKVTAALEGLTLSTTYRVRLLTTAGGSTSDGPESTFATFGIESYTIEALNEQGEQVSQAGAHPYELLVHIVTNTSRVPGVAKGEPAPGRREQGALRPDGMIKDLLTQLPPGVIGNPTAVPACLARTVEEDLCSGNAQVGVVEIVHGSQTKAERAPLYNTIPPEGTPAEFAGEVNLSTEAFVTAKVRSGGDYGITAGSENITGLAEVWAVTVRMWGGPANARHNPERVCGYKGAARGCSSTLTEERPFLRLPSSCLGPQQSTAVLDSYQGVGAFVERGFVMPAFTGCQQLQFNPTLEAAATTAAVDSPSGLNVELSVPQNEEPEKLGTSDLKDATVTFPPGLAVNPSSASGLAGCTPEQVGLEMTPAGEQRISVEPTLERTFTVSFEGHQTAALSSEATASQVQQALEALPGIGAGGVAVTGNGGVFTVRFLGALATRLVSKLTGTAARMAVESVKLRSPNVEELEKLFGTERYYENDTFNIALDGQSTGASLEATAHIHSMGSGNGIGYIEESSITAHSGTVVDGEQISGPGIPEGTLVKLNNGRIELISEGFPAGEGEFTGTYGVSLPSRSPADVVEEALALLPAVARATVSGGSDGQKQTEEIDDGYLIGFVPANGYEAKALEVTPALENVPQSIKSEYEAAGNPPLSVSVLREGGVPHMNGEAAKCPPASKLGTVQIETPLLNHPIPGGLYLATPHENPFGSLIAVYLAAYDPVSGVVIKLPGEVNLNPSTGQVSTTFNNDPQLPFSHLKVNLFADEKRAAFTTPETCGSFTTASLLTPWDGNAAATPESRPFAVGSEPGGGACPATESQAPNAPGFRAGTASPIAGAYSPFVLRLTRQDGSQRFGALDVTLPPGMLGNISGVQECPHSDVEAAERLTSEGDGALEVAHPSCPAGSQVGVVHVGAGSGAPLFVNGTAYFAGPYKGAPFSLVFVTPAIAGPFDLGVVTVRAALYIDPHTAQVSVKSDPFPTILDGIPLDIRSVGVEMSRPDFTLNPTNCNVMAVAGSLISTANQTAGLSDRFQVGGCRGMPFKPSFSAETLAFHSRKGGAYLHVHVGTGAGQANIAKVHVAIPGVLPARNDTLKLACTEEQFNKDPEGCPAGSIIGHAVAHTPILPVPLEGPVMFVSHGSRGFPDVEVLLKGDGVNVTLEGETFINKKGQTFSTFASVPDVPVSSFDMYLPEGPHSALAANGNLCRHVVVNAKRVRIRVKARTEHGRRMKAHYVYRTREVRNSVRVRLLMPTEITGQNGAVVRKNTLVHVEGCEPQITVVTHRTRGRSARIVVDVPSAGKLVAGGKGVSGAVKHVNHAGRVPIVVKLDRHDQLLLVQHPRRRLKVNVRLRFDPPNGHALQADVTVLIP